MIQQHRRFGLFCFLAMENPAQQGLHPAFVVKMPHFQHALELSAVKPQAVIFAASVYQLLFVRRIADQHLVHFFQTDGAFSLLLRCFSRLK